MMSADGPQEKCDDVRYRAAVGVKADSLCAVGRGNLTPIRWFFALSSAQIAFGSAADASARTERRLRPSLAFRGWGLLSVDHIGHGAQFIGHQA
jgi:hypothetical protein